MKFGNLLILMVVAAGLGWGAIALYQKQHDDMTQDRAANGLARGQRLFDNLTEQAVRLAKVEFTRSSDTIVLARDENQEWVIASLNNYPADPAQINKLVMNLTDIRVGDRQTAREEMYTRFGLQGQVGSQGVIILSDQADAPLGTLMLGREREADPMAGSAAGMSGGRYVRVNDDPMVYLVQEQLFWLGTEIIDWVQREILAVPADQIVALTIEHPTTATVSVRWDGASPIVEDLAQGLEEPNISQLAAARGALNGLSMTDVITSGSARAESLEQQALFTARAKDGTIYQVAVLEDDSDNSFLALSARYDAPTFTADDKTSTETLQLAEEMADKAKDEIAPFNKRHGPWLYQVSSWNRDKFVKYRSDVVDVVVENGDDDGAFADWDALDTSDWPEAQDVVWPDLAPDAPVTDDEATTSAQTGDETISAPPLELEDETTTGTAPTETGTDDQDTTEAVRVLSDDEPTTPMVVVAPD